MQVIAVLSVSNGEKQMKADKIPVISLAKSSVDAFRLFNPNDWSGISKAIILSCSTELSLLHFEEKLISKLCRYPKKLCKPHFESFQKSWVSPNSSLPKTVCFAQVPELHTSIKALFACFKGLLDLIVQLLSSEGIVNASLNGFHRKDKNGVTIYGATVLNALKNNACAAKKTIAKNIYDLINSHKEKWIDNVIEARDFLIHPQKGTHQVMFEIKLKSVKNTLVYKNAVPPSVESFRVDIYAKNQIKNVENFAKSFLKELKDVEGHT